MMRRNRLSRILFLSAAIPLLAACHRNRSQSRDLQLLTHTPWKYEKAGFNADDEGSFDALNPQIAGCERDNFVIFRIDGTGILQEGRIKCKPADPDSLPFYWSFQDNDSMIYFQDQYYKVQLLDKDHFEIYADQRLGGIKTRYTIVFKH